MVIKDKRIMILPEGLDFEEYPHVVTAIDIIASIMSGAIMLSREDVGGLAQNIIEFSRRIANEFFDQIHNSFYQGLPHKGKEEYVLDPVEGPIIIDFTLRFETPSDFLRHYIGYKHNKIIRENFANRKIPEFMRMLAAPDNVITIDDLIFTGILLAYQDHGVEPYDPESDPRNEPTD